MANDHDWHALLEEAVPVPEVPATAIPRFLATIPAARRGWRIRVRVALLTAGLVGAGVALVIANLIGKSRGVMPAAPYAPRLPNHTAVLKISVAPVVVRPGGTITVRASSEANTTYGAAVEIDRLTVDGSWRPSYWAAAYVGYAPAHAVPWGNNSVRFVGYSGTTGASVQLPTDMPDGKYRAVKSCCPDHPVSVAAEFTVAH